MHLSAGAFLFPHPRFAAPAGAAFLPSIPCPFLGWETLLGRDGKAGVPDPASTATLLSGEAGSGTAAA